MAFGMLSAYAQTVSVSDVTMNPGETKVVSINLSNSQTNIVSFQMDLTLPDGITINKAGCSLGSRITDADQELTIGKQADGSIRLTSTSLALKPITGTSGEIIKLSLTAASDAKGGTATLKNIVLATSDSQKLKTANASFKVNVLYTLTYKVDGEVYKTASIACGSTITPETAPTKEGYTFSGWSNLPTTMPNHNVEVTGTYTINSYFLFYVLDGEIYKTLSIQYGAAITPETVPAKEGYTFSGWSNVPETMPAHDVTIQGQYNINSHTLTYKVDGQVYKIYTLEYHAAITPEPAPTKEGYTFSGWSNIPELMPDNDVVVTGTFSINSYTLTYMVDGEVYKTSTFVFGTAITPEPAPTKEGYTFSGWSEVPATMPAHDVTITGSFSINSYTLTYKVDGEVYKTSTVVYGTSITPEVEPTKEGYTFSGWSEIPETMPAHDVTVSGSFTINKYKLTYFVDGAVYKSYKIDYASTIIPEAAPTKEGHTFSGWNGLPATMPAHDVEVTGSFSINSYTLTYLVDGEVYKTSTIVYGTALTPEPTPTKEGYTFSGWDNVPETMPAHDVVVTGSFSVNSYFLFYVLDGSIYKAYNIKYGTIIVPETVPDKEGYTFSGWSELPEIMPAHDVTVQGQYNINSHTLTYKVDGQVYKTYTLEYHTTITPEPAPTKEGYTFSGWSEIPELMPDNDVVVTGTFSINSYTLTYKVDGEVYKTSTVVFGTATTPEPAPTKEGHTFSGWSEIPATMPAHDVEVTGSFSINSYTITYMVDGEVYKTVSVVYGTSVTPEPAPTKEGYTFSGWSGIPKTMPAKDVVVTGSFTINNYTLTYKVDGKIYKTYSVEYGTALIPEAEPSKAGYTFSGWSEIPATMPARDVTVTGSFIVKLATGIVLDKEVLLFNSVEPQKLNVTLTPADLINKTVAWSSSNTQIATVDADGVVTPVNNGEAVITVSTTDGSNLKATCKVTIDFKAASLSIDKKVVTITELKSQKLTAIITPEGASQEVVWSSSNASVVTVDKTGTIKPRRNGEAVITAVTTDGTQLEATCKVTVNISSLFEAKVTQTTLTVSSKSGMAEARNVKLTIDGEEYDAAMITGLAPNQSYHVKATADIGNYNWTEELDVTTMDIEVSFSSNASPTTLDIIASYNAGDATVTYASFSREVEVNTLNFTGLEPAQRYEYTYYITTEEGGTASYKAQFTTETLDLKISQTKVVQVGDVVVVANSNIVEEDNVSVGFEWRRYDWPDEIENRSGAAYIYEGTIEGSVKNLYAEKFWKIRPYFQSQAGTRYWGDWVTIDPSDASYFEPSVHTYNTINVEDNTAEVKGFVMEGSEDVESQGFMYWENKPSSSGRKKANGVPANAKIVEATGNMMVVSLDNLEYDTEYCYVAFVKTSDGETFFGEVQTFKTGEVDPDGIKEIKNEELRMKNGEGDWYDLSGRKLDKPQNGINIIRYADGTSKKVLVK